MTPIVRAAVAALCVAAHAAAGIFDVGGKPAQRAVVTVTPADPVQREERSPMLDRLAGVLAELDAKQVTQLRASAAGAGAQPVSDVTGMAHVAFIHLNAGPAWRRVEILREPSGRFVARDPDEPKQKAVRLVADKFAPIAAAWPAYRGDYTRPPGAKPATAGPLGVPLVPSPIIIDTGELHERILHGLATDVAGSERVLEKERFLCRLPKGNDPREAAGLIVWVDAGREAALHEPLHAACDELGLVLVGAVDTGNGRPRSDRYQLALDAAATVSNAVLIDRRRVYVAGISGGGKIATHLWAGYPEVFKGAVPIVGLATYRAVPAGPGKVWPEDFGRPAPKVLKMVQPNRCAAMTGEKDFNHDAIIATAKLLTADGLAVRVFDYPDMGHDLPMPERFADALRWVDEPARALRDKELADATALVTKAAIDPDKPPTPDQRVMLVEVTRLAPWSAPAWRAARALGAVPE